MRITVKAKNGASADTVRKYAEQKAAKLERYFRHIDSVVVEHAVERGLHVLEVTVEGDGIALRSEERSGDLYAAVDNAVEKMEKQVTRFKSRVRRTHRRQPSARETAAEREAVAVGDADDEIEEPEAELRIVRRKRFPLKAMPPEDAARQMELLNHTFFLFLNEESGSINVLYRRLDGDYGLIEPED